MAVNNVLDPLAKAVFISFLHGKLRSLLPFSILQERGEYVHLILKEGEGMLSIL